MSIAPAYAQRRHPLPAAESHGWRAFHLDGRELATKTEFIETSGRAMRFPSYSGNNWDAFEESLNDLSWAPAQGYLVVFDGAGGFARSQPDEFAMAVDILRESVKRWDALGIPWWCCCAGRVGRPAACPGCDGNVGPVANRSHFLTVVEMDTVRSSRIILASIFMLALALAGCRAELGAPAATSTAVEGAAAPTAATAAPAQAATVPPLVPTDGRVKPAASPVSAGADTTLPVVNLSAGQTEMPWIESTTITATVLDHVGVVSLEVLLRDQVLATASRASVVRPDPGRVGWRDASRHLHLDSAG